MLQSIIPITTLLAIVILYATFDLFNKRNVPDLFAYASIVAGLVITVVYNSDTLALSLGIAAAVGIISYAVYRLGLWGAGDGFELVAVSLIFPLQPMPLFGYVPQFGLPFVLSVFVMTGLVATLAVPFYYLLFTKRTVVREKTGLKHMFFGILLLSLYAFLFIFTFFFDHLTLGSMLLMILIAVPSSITLMFEEKITARMVTDTSPKELEEGDIIAFNMMSEKEMHYFTKKYPKFGRLATKKAIRELRNEKHTLPVYKNAAPLAVFIGAGVVFSLLFGNIIFLLL